MDLFDRGPMGPSRMEFQKPVIAAITGYCVAGRWYIYFARAHAWIWPLLFDYEKIFSIYLKITFFQVVLNLH